MKNTIGTSVTMTLFGESHGPAVGVVLDGLARGPPARRIPPAWSRTGSGS